MKILLKILAFIETFLGLTVSNPDISPTNVDVAWTNGSKVAVITITFKSVSILTHTVIVLLSDWLKAHEHVLSLNVKDNTFIVEVSV